MFVGTVKLVLPVANKTLQRQWNNGRAYSVLSNKSHVLENRMTFIGNLTLARYLSQQRLTNSLTLISNTPRKLVTDLSTTSPDLRFAFERPAAAAVRRDSDDQPPLCIIIGWLMSRQKHVLKYAKFYLDQGFDVLHVSCSPWQLLWPVTGGKVISKDILTFCGNNQHYGTTVLHGFSVGAYVWGQLLVHMSEHPEKYQYMHRMMVGQIWDSIVDVEGVVQGVGGAVFPNNRLLKNLLESYVKFHVNTFQESVMQHYLQTSVVFHNSEIRTPTLFFCSEDDPVSLYYIVERIADRWEQNGCPVYWKSWKSSPHVSHIWRYPEEYRAEMKAFLDRIGVLKYPERFPVKVAARN